MQKLASVLALTVVLGTEPSMAQELPSLFLDELTWMEVADAIDAGTTTIIIPTAGTEQNGPHMVLGKHKFIVTAAAERIARQLGNALVAPTVTYVPEGTVERIRGNRQRAGTITLPNEHYMKLLEYAARSLEAGGFTDIVMIGDSGGNQRGMEEVAAMLNREWSDGPGRVHFVGDYYANNGVNEWLNSQGETDEAIGSHAGIRDTSQLWALHPEHIRVDLLAPGGGFEGSGVRGDASRASIEYGRKGLELKVAAAVSQTRELIANRR